MSWSPLILVSIAIAFVGAELIRTDALAALEDILSGSKSAVWKPGGLEPATAIGDEVMTGRGRIWEIAIDTWRDGPLLGFGAHAWDSDFRAYHGIPSGVHVHNQWLQVPTCEGIIPPPFASKTSMSKFALIGAAGYIATRHMKAIQATGK